MTRDLRIYEYQNGTLKKIGKSKSDKIKRQKHYFNSIDEVECHVFWLREKGIYINSQIILIEYLNTYQSKIIQIL